MSKARVNFQSVYIHVFENSARVDGRKFAVTDRFIVGHDKCSTATAEKKPKMFHRWQKSQKINEQTISQQLENNYTNICKIVE